MLGRGLVTGALLGLAACSSGAGGSGQRFTGTPGEPASAVVFSNVLLADIAVDGVKGQRAVVDTGSPIVVVQPASFPNVPLPNGDGTVDTLGLGALTFNNPPVVGANLIASPDPTVPIGGVLGCTLFCSFPVSLNYRDAQVTLGTGAAPPNVQPGASAPFRLEGGGIAQITGVPGTVPFPPSRVSVNVTIEGAQHPMVVDTGASFVFLRVAVFQQLTSDGRATIAGLSANSIEGMSQATVARTMSMVVGNAQASGVAATADPSLENLLDGIASEIGHPVDGLLGGTFLRNFLVTVDYPNRVLVLAPYSSLGFILDEFERVGVAFGTATPSGGYPVGQVFQGTDAAAKGVALGDVIVAVDGTQLAPLGPTAASALLSGAVGSTKMVQFAAAGSPALANQTVAIRVDELLPP